MPNLPQSKQLTQPNAVNCENEALHLSGAIQAYGTLLALDKEGVVTHAAQNLAAFLDFSPEQIMGQPLRQPYAGLIATLGPKPGTRKIFAGAIEGKTGVLDLIATRGDAGHAVLEFSPHSGPERLTTAIPLSSDLPLTQANLSAARQRLLAEILTLTQFQRVMYYLFREDGDGEVVNEALQGDVYGSYLGLRFPASDIPQVARDLYLKNPWRLITDSAAQVVPIASRAGTPLDLSWANLRSVSPVHRTYLQNMGVTASFSFPVITGGGLTALIAAHHNQARLPSLAVMERVSARIHAHAFALASFQTQSRMRMIDGLSRRFEHVQAAIARTGDIMASWKEIAPSLMQEFGTDGGSLCLGDTCLNYGASLEPDNLALLDTWFREQHNEVVWMGDNLGRQIPGFALSQVAGALALRVTRRGGQDVRIYLTRIEHSYEVAWGGHPQKPIERRDGEYTIAPRHSFEKWIEKRLGYSRAWDNEARLLLLNLRETLAQEIRL